MLLAAGLWGTLGTLYTWGKQWYGLSPVTIVFWRAALAAIAVGAVLAVVMPASGRGWSYLKASAQDVPLFAAFGLLGVTAFYLLYVYAVVLVGVAVAVVLLYTAPVFVALMAWRFLGEPLTERKLIALGLTVAGCALVARVYNVSRLQVDTLGILCGLGSAVTYALYSILGKISLRRGHPIATLSFYIYAIGSGGLLIVALFMGPAQLFSMGADPGAWALLGILAIVQTLGALAAYTSGLKYLEAGVASIIATLEPVVATALAFIVLHEQVEWAQIVGGVLILSAVLLLQARARVPEAR